MDAIRGLAAIVVMLGHSRVLFFQSLNGQTEAATVPASGAAGLHSAPLPQINMGYEAVMIFFVLSGYLVGGSVLRAFRRNSWSWKEYLTKRLTRLWMVLLPALLLTLAFDHVGFRLFSAPTSIYQGPPGQSEVPANLLHTLTPRVIAGNAVFLQNILVTTAGTNIALWSLSNEFWYYLIFPLIVIACWRTASPPARMGCALLAALLLVFIGRDEAFLFPTWILGALISLLPLRLTERASKWLFATLMLLLPVVMVLVRRLDLSYFLGQSLIAIYFGVLLYVTLNRTKMAKRGLYPRIATLLSDLSYPLYLVHLPILVFLCAAINRPWHQWSRTPANMAIVFALDATTIGAAYLFHLCFQRHTEAVRLALLGRIQQQQHVPLAN